jgi:alpha-acetolactate decarboxylase
MEAPKPIRATFEPTAVESVIVGFHSAWHRGIFTPVNSNIHLHFQTSDGSKSGHVNDLKLGFGATLSLPASN